jgi:hypothetical protein
MELATLGKIYAYKMSVLRTQYKNSKRNLLKCWTTVDEMLNEVWYGMFSCEFANPTTDVSEVDLHSWGCELGDS